MKQDWVQGEFSSSLKTVITLPHPEGQFLHDSFSSSSFSEGEGRWGWEREKEREKYAVMYIHTYNSEGRGMGSWASASPLKTEGNWPTGVLLLSLTHFSWEKRVKEGRKKDGERSRVYLQPVAWSLVTLSPSSPPLCFNWPRGIGSAITISWFLSRV